MMMERYCKDNHNNNGFTLIPVSTVVQYASINTDLWSRGTSSGPHAGP